jgi:hypothetical protein
MNMNEQLNNDVEKMNKARELYAEMAKLILETEYSSEMFSALQQLEELLDEGVEYAEEEE